MAFAVSQSWLEVNPYEYGDRGGSSKHQVHAVTMVSTATTVASSELAAVAEHGSEH